MVADKIEGFPLSPQQRRIWLSQRNSLAYRSACAVLLKGDLKAESLRLALQSVVERHEILRTTFQYLPGLKVPLQVVSPKGEALWRDVGLEWVEAGERESHLKQHFRKACRAPFNFEAGPLLQATILKFADNFHALILALPSLCADAVTLKNLVQETGEFYAALQMGQERPIDEPVQYVEFTGWQNSVLDGDGQGIEFLNKALPEGVHNFGLPFEQNCTSGMPFTPGSLSLPGLVIAAARLKAATQGRVSNAVFILACLQTLLWRLTHNPVFVNIIFDGRAFEELKKALGPFAKSVPLGCSFTGDLRFDDVLLQVARHFAEAAEMQGFCYADNPSALPTDDCPPPPMISFEYVEWPAAQVYADASFAFCEQYDCVDAYRLKLSCFHDGDQIKFVFGYDRDFFRPADVESLATYFITILEDALNHPTSSVCELHLLPEREMQGILKNWSMTDGFETNDLCFHQAFEQQVKRTPDAIALEFGSERLTYADLNRRSNSLAHYLSERGVGAEVHVGICIERSSQMIVGIMGILKAGGAYVPLEPTYPRDYLAFMLDDAGVSLLLTSSQLRDKLPEHSLPTLCLDVWWESIANRESDEDPASEASADNIAYVIYTSGSTGRPNGVMISHRSMMNLARALQRSVYAGRDGRLRASLNAPLAFDASVKQLLLLACGHTLHILPDAVRRDGMELRSYLQEQRIDVFDCTPTQLKLLLQSAQTNGELHIPRLLLIGGEPIDESTWQTLAALTRTDSFNVYGPTEATVDATACLIRDAARPNIGRPLPNVQVLILDDHLQVVPAGTRGEMYIGGTGLARGYLNRPALTAERFIPHPYSNKPGERLYRTGDLARYLPDGSIEFAWRRDRQVKVRGFRIEVGEIQNLLQSHPMVRDALVLKKEGEQGTNRLFAYIVPKDRCVLMFGDRKPYRLPNNIVIAQLSKHETDYLYQEIFEDQTYVRHGIDLREGDCVFDVGANIGLATLFFHYYRQNIKIFAFEPIPTLFEILKLNTKLHGVNATVLPCGISNRTKQASISFYPDYSIMSGLYADAIEEEETVRAYILNQHQLGQSGDGELLSHLGEFLEGRFESQQVTCQLRSLSDIIREEHVRRIDLLKIDVQKSELDVLRGIEAQDWEKIRQIAMEVHDYEGRLDEAVALLKSKGYDLVVEQDASLKNTDRFHIYARQDAPLHDRPAAPDGGSWKVAAGLDFSIDELREYVKNRLPEQMQPAAYFVLEKIPLTANGKVDADALPEEINPQLGGTCVAPRTPTEQLLSTIWSEVLGRREVGIYDHFFDLGGDSILQVQVIVKANEAGFRLLPKHLFQHPTIAELAEVAEGLRKSEPEQYSLTISAPATLPHSSPEEQSSSAGSPRYAPSDFPEAGLTQNELDEIIARLTQRGEGELS